MRDFYEHQDRAFARSARLVLLLLFAACGTIAATGVALTYLFVVLLTCLSLNATDFQLQLLEIFAIICVVSSILMTVSSLHKMKQLKAGGKVIALDLGGELIEPNPRNRHQRRALNIVEEMAVASGIPAPAVYRLPNQLGINAFAAGFTFDDAVIGITQGCLERLNRQQLQGVIAHEFSHVLNGDMRLNLKLVGVLHGLLGVSLFAEALLQTAHELTSNPDPHGDGVTETGMALLLALSGVLLWPVGLIGTVFGLIVMGAASRQREYLADAYAVQFTRYPDGLAGALKVLLGCEDGSCVRTAKSLEASHFFFAPGCRLSMGLMATHPPLEERIRRLDPEWDGLPLFEDDDGDEFPEAEGDVEPAHNASPASLPSPLAEANPLSSSATPPSMEEGLAPSIAPEPFWDACRSGLPTSWINVISDPIGCQSVLIAQWLGATQDQHALVDALESSRRQDIVQMIDELSPVDERERIVLFHQAIEQLNHLTASQQKRLKRQVRSIVDAIDDQDVSAWAIGCQLRQRLGMLEKPADRKRYGKLLDVQPACEVLLSMMCHMGSDHEAMAQYAYQRAVLHMELREPEFWAFDELTCERLDAAVALIAEIAPRPRRRFLQALERSLAADLTATFGEVQFMRGLCVSLDLPVPTLLPGEPLVPGK